jgi:hypothetical protein
MAVSPTVVITDFSPSASSTSAPSPWSAARSRSGSTEFRSSRHGDLLGARPTQRLLEFGSRQRRVLLDVFREQVLQQQRQVLEASLLGIRERVVALDVAAQLAHVVEIPRHRQRVFRLERVRQAGGRVTRTEQTRGPLEQALSRHRKHDVAHAGPDRDADFVGESREPGARNERRPHLRRRHVAHLAHQLDDGRVARSP